MCGRGGKLRAGPTGGKGTCRCLDGRAAAHPPRVPVPHLATSASGYPFACPASASARAHTRSPPSLFASSTAGTAKVPPHLPLRGPSADAASANRPSSHALPRPRASPCTIERSREGASSVSRGTPPRGADRVCASRSRSWRRDDPSRTAWLARSTGENAAKPPSCALRAPGQRAYALVPTLTARISLTASNRLESLPALDFPVITAASYTARPTERCGSTASSSSFTSGRLSTSTDRSLPPSTSTTMRPLSGSRSMQSSSASP